MTRDQIIEEIQFGATRAELALKLGLSPAKLDIYLAAIKIKWSSVPKVKATPGRVANAKRIAPKAWEASAKLHRTKTAFGVTDSYAGLFRRFGVTSKRCFESRIRKGMSLEEALTKPVTPHGERNAKDQSVLPEVSCQIQQQEQGR